MESKKFTISPPKIMLVFYLDGDWDSHSVSWRAALEAKKRPDIGGAFAHFLNISLGKGRASSSPIEIQPIRLETRDG